MEVKIGIEERGGKEVKEGTASLKELGERS